MNKALHAACRMHPFRYLTSFLTALLILMASSGTKAQTTLAVGDLSIVAFSASPGSKGISFVPWVSLSAGTKIRFTDNGFHSVLASTLTGNARWQEQVVTWTASSAVTAGTVVSISEGPSSSTGTVTIVNANGTATNNWDLNNVQGDQVFAYQSSGNGTQGDFSTFNGTLLCGLGYQASAGNIAWSLLGPVSASTSCLPLELVLNSIYFAGNATGAQYTGTRTAFPTLDAYKASVANPLLWSAVTGTSNISYNLTAFSATLPPPVVTTDPASTSVCAGAGTSFSVTATGATSYQWQVDGGLGWLPVLDLPPYTGAQTATLNLSFTTSLMDGTKFRCVVVGTGIVNSGVAVLNTSNILITGSQTNVLCNGGSTGSVTVTPTGGIAPYTYLWSPSGGTGASATGLAAGTYTVKVKDNIGCEDTRSFTILQPTALDAVSSFTNVSCNGGSNGSAAVLVGGGVFPYTFSWSPSGGSANFATGLSAGNYTVTAADQNGCTIARNFTITEPAALTATISQTNVSCHGGFNGSATVTPAGGTAPYGYLWLPTGGLGATADYRPAGTYSVLVTDSKGCSITKNVTITQPSALAVTPSQVNVSCFGGSNGSASVSVTGGSGSYSYSWTGSNSTAATATGLSSGAYTCTVTDANGCSATQVFIIAQPAPMILATLHTDVSCSGFFSGSASVTVLGGVPPYSYNWSPSGGTGAIATGLAAGNYTVTVTDAYGCSKVQSITIGQATTITATVSQTNVSCNGASDGSATVAASGGIQPYTYLWSPYGGTGATASGLAAGTYTVTIRGAGGCAINKIVTITEPSASAPAFISQPAGVSINEQDNTGFSVTASNAATYQWQVNKGTGFTDLTESAPYSGVNTPVLTITATPLAFDGYTYRCVIGGGCGVTLASQPAVLVISAGAAQTITFPAMLSVVYGTPDFNPGASSDSGLPVVYTSSDESIATIVNGKIHTKKVGTVIITASQPGNADYKPAVPVQRPLTITPRSITLSVPSTPLISKEYDGNVTAIVPPANYQLNGLVNNDQVSVSANAAYDTKNVGTFKDIVISQPVLTGDDKDNYILLTTSAYTTGEIRKKMLTAALNELNLIAKEYDGNTHATLVPGNYILTGMIGTEQVFLNNPVAGTYDTKHGGDHKLVTVTGLAISGPDAGNYEVPASVQGATGLITRKQISVSATPFTKIYGQHDPEFLYTVAGLIAGDTLPGSLGREPGKDVGVYAILIGNLNAGGTDYVVESFISSTLTITPEQLLISADDKWRVWGVENPVFTFTYTGLVGTNPAAELSTLPSAGTVAHKGSPIGEYDINVWGASSKNYTITYDTGSLVVMPDNDRNMNYRIWSSSPGVVQFRIYSRIAQQANVYLYTRHGQQVIMHNQYLTVGMNSFEVNVGQLAAGIYMVAINAGQYRIGEKIMIR